MSEIEKLAANVRILTQGWSERVETKTLGDSGLELAIKRIRHDGLLSQLLQASLIQSSSTGGGHSTNKPESRLPGNSAATNLLDVIAYEAREHYLSLWTYVHCEHPQHLTTSLPQAMRTIVDMCTYVDDDEYEGVYEAMRASSTWVRKSRILLGYQASEITLRDTVCDNCGGNLAVARDASTDVRCTGTEAAVGCGRTYTRADWLTLALDAQAEALTATQTASEAVVRPRASRKRQAAPSVAVSELITTAEAVALIAGPDADAAARARAVNRLRTWRKRGLVTNHGGDRRGRALWPLGDVQERLSDPLDAAIGVQHTSHVGRVHALKQPPREATGGEDHGQQTR